MGKFQFGKFVGILMVFATYVSQTRANTSVVIEAVDDYSYYTGNHLSDTDAIEEATPFWNQMGSSNLWTQNTFWQNSDVWDVDFYDPDLTGSSSDDGDAYLDMPGGAISWAIGHGMCDDVTTTTCTTDADCASVGGYCPKFGPVPANSSKVCIKQLNRKFVTSSSTTNSHGNVAYYGQLPLSKSLAIGEDYYSGGFDGAGTNGGMNVFMLTNSCRLRPPYWVQDLSYIFAGMQLMMMNVPVAAWKTNGATNSNFSDTSQWSARGSTLVSSI